MIRMRFQTMRPTLLLSIKKTESGLERILAVSITIKNNIRSLKSTFRRTIKIPLAEAQLEKFIRTIMAIYGSEPKMLA